MKFGLVELHVDLSALTAHDPADAVHQGIRRDAGRPRTVQYALDHTVRCGCDLVLFPGWTLVASKPPPWLVEASAGRTVVVECLLPDAAKPGPRPERAGRRR